MAECVRDIHEEGIGAMVTETPVQRIEYDPIGSL
jgi:hypothetical protein